MRTLLAALLLCAAGASAADEALSSPWKSVAPGVDVASAADLGADASWAARVVLIDPEKVQFAVRFDPETPRLDEWRKRFPDAIAISVGSFFSADKTIRPTCDLIAEGRAHKGAGCHRQDALYFGAHPQAKHPVAALPTKHLQRSHRLPPAPPQTARARPRLLDPADFKPDQWTEALKSFPALVRGGFPSCVGPKYCTELSRTAAVAQLRDGRIALFASQWPAPRDRVARFLVETLGAEEALNLDGGPEATLALQGEPADEAVSSPGVPLPFVLLVLPRAE